MAVINRMPPLPAGAVDFNRLNDAVAAGKDAAAAIAEATGAKPARSNPAPKTEAKAPADAPAPKADSK